MPYASAIDGSWLVAALLLSLRLGPALAATPLLSASGIPSLVRVVVVIGLSSVLALGLPGAPLSAASARTLLDDGGAMVVAAAQELALGATMGLGIQLAFAALSAAGGLLGIQVGFGLATALNPAISRQEPLLAAAFSQVGVLVFFLVDGHHALLRGLALSLERVPLGRPWAVEAAAGPILRQAGGFLALGFALAAPVVLVVLLIDVALGVVGRNLPQVNMLAVGIPVKLVAGLVALALWGPAMGSALNRVYAAAFSTWGDLLGCAAWPGGGLHG